ncbi:MAG: DUF5655 domain-containing protein [Actinomycetota bacterium]
MCAPGLTIEEFFAQSQPWERPVFDRVRSHLDDLGPLIVEPVQVGILFKNGPTFAELRPKKKWIALSFMHPVPQASNRFSRKITRVGGTGSRYYHVLNVDDPGQIDEQVNDWLTEAYFEAER